MELMQLSGRTISKILKRMNIACFKCGWNLATCDIHHIVPRKNNGSDALSNLTILCPNCHRVAHQNKETVFPTIEEKIGDTWKDFYFSEGTSNPKVRKQISEGMKKAHAEGRANSF